MTEPSNDFQYGLVNFKRDTLGLFLRAIDYYQSILTSNRSEIGDDPFLKELFAGGTALNLPIGDELDRVATIQKMISNALSEQKQMFPIIFQVSHWWVKYVKSITLAYVSNLKSKRNRFSNKPGISRSLLDAVDQQISKYEESINLGVFKEASTVPLLVLPATDPTLDVPGTSVESAAARIHQSADIVIESISILDEEIRSRCMDLFGSFSNSQQHDRLDTVIIEVTRIFEDRLRRLSKAPAETTGVDLATYALGGKPPRIQLSSVQAEQEGAHLLFRGVFGFVRNKYHHALVSELRPERVLQIIGMIDYLVFLLEGRIVESA